MTDRGRAGFTLLEALVALVILGLGLAVLYGWVGDGTRGSAVAERQRIAAAAARSMLAELGRSEPLVDGESEGDLKGGLHWHLAVTAANPAVTDGPPPVLTGHLVVLTMSWTADGRPVAQSFQTLLIGAGG